MRMFKLTISIVLTLLLVACGRVQPIMEVEDTPVGYNLQSEQVKLAIIEAATSRGWIAKETKPGLIEANITLRTHSAAITIPYTNKFYSIHYASSVNLKASDGKIHRNYNRWINNLNVDIQHQLAVAAAKQ